LSFFCIFIAENFIMRLLIKLLFCFSVFTAFSQEIETEKSVTKVDSLYREDQFYGSMSFSMMQTKPQSYSVTKLSAGFSAGFLRDMPINKSRTIAIAAGLGASYNKFVHNLVVTKPASEILYSVISSSDYDKNKLELATLDVPIELRWRNSTPESHRFFRIYSGVKMSYVAFSKSRFVNDGETIKIRNNPDINSFRTSVYLSFGYNTWNFYGSYGLTPIFKSSAKVDSQEIGLNNINLGLMFYIL
jgi:hypothetical protein